MARTLFTLARAATLAAAALTLGAAAASAEYPEKPVTVVSPYGPGGAADLAARTLANTAPEFLGESLVVVNKTGASGVTGSTFVAKARPDGYTLLLARVGSQAAIPALNSSIPYKWDDYAFLGLLEQNPFALTVNADLPYKTFEDLKKAIQDGAELSYSSAAVGGLQHLGMVVLLQKLGVDPESLKHVPFKGGGKAAAAVVGGHVDILFQNLSGVISHMESGGLRALAVTTDERSPRAPDVPTFKELGYPDMNVILGWSGLWGPKDLPQEVVDKWVGVLDQLSKDEAWTEATLKLGSTPMILPPAETKVFVEKQYSLFKSVIDDLGIGIE